MHLWYTVLKRVKCPKYSIREKSMQTTVRQATEQDIARVADAILTSSRAGRSRGIFDVIFEESDDGALHDRVAALCLSETRSYCHYTNFLIAERSGTTVGTLCGYEPRRATLEQFSKALSEVGIDEDYKERIAAYLLVAPAIDRQTWVLDFMTVDKGVDPLPVFEILLKKSLLTARLKGYRKAQTMVEIGSFDAQKLYEKLGFSVIDEKRSDLFEELFHRPGIKRLQMTL